MFKKSMLKKSMLSIVISTAILSGCDSSESTIDTTPTVSPQVQEINVTIIDGYLNNATTWLDVNGNFMHDNDEPITTSGESGLAVLDVTGVDNPSSYSIVVQANKLSTIDESTNSLVVFDYVMSAPPGEFVITPLSTLVQLNSLQAQIENNSLSTEIIIEKIAASLGIESDSVLGDYIKSNHDKALYAATNVIASGIFPTTPTELNIISQDASDSSNFSIEMIQVNAEIKASIDYANSGDTDIPISDFQPVYLPATKGELCVEGFIKIGTTNICVADTDNDGFSNSNDAFPLDDTEWVDTDLDGIGNNADTDDDNDGILDTSDAFPLDDTEWFDTDADGAGNNADTDDDNDGIDDLDDIYPLDTDNDGLTNIMDLDDDNDDIPDANDEYPLDPTQAGEMPQVYLLTDNNDVIQNGEYTYGVVTIDGENHFSNIDDKTMKIKGRGNSTWWMPKKPYQLKFDKKTELLAMPEDKKWIFLAEYTDKSLLRNTLAFEMGYLSSLDYTPQGEFAEVYINDEYNGVYNITQKVEVSKNRLNLSDDGYLLEIDQLSRLDPDDVYFSGDLNYLFNIKEPSLDFDDDKFNLIKEQINTFEAVLNSTDFADPVMGYRTLIDVDNFVDFYLINEIARTSDIFWSSTYLNIEPNEKIKMGPLWDFDISFGNINYSGNESPIGFRLKNFVWYKKLFKDPYFVNKVKERFEYYRKNQSLLTRKIDNYAYYLTDAKTRNYERWETLGQYVWPNYVWFDTYQEEVDYLKEWLSLRMDWLDDEFSAM